MLAVAEKAAMGRDKGCGSPIRPARRGYTALAA